MTPKLLLVVCLLCSCSLFDDDETFAIEGTVRFSPIELGCWYVLTKDDLRYEPIDMPEELEVDGLFVRLIVRPREDAESICMVGRLVEIVRVVETGTGATD